MTGWALKKILKFVGEGCAPNQQLCDNTLKGLEQSANANKTFYLQSYPSLVSGCQTLLINKHVVSAGHLVYAWMPTIIKRMDDPVINKIGKLLLNYGHYRELKLAQLVDVIRETDRPLLNNSWVGTSKLLHFAYPHFIPIWDSRVAQAFGIRQQNLINNKESFLSYIDYINMHCDSPFVSPVKDWVGDRFSPISGVRALELMYYANPNMRGHK